ncbi:MtnX-like HAD-IB family phosphatase [Chloroflexota bacterium]
MIIQCDFDGTIIEDNLSVLIREHFAPEAWRVIEKDYLERRIAVEESNRRQFALIKEPKERLQEFVHYHIQVRQGFPKFVADCEANGHTLIIVSSGLDFYIETVLKELGILNIELYCGRTEFTENGIVVKYSDHNGNVIEHGFKLRCLNWLKQRDKTIVYIGDSLSDLDAARNASYVFATGHLASLLTEENMCSWSSFNNFLDIRDKLPLLES